MSLLTDLRFGVRMLIKRPGIAAIAVVALALGIGLTTMMFSIVYGLVIRGLPYPDSERLVDLSRSRPASNSGLMAVTIHDLEDWRAQQTSFEEIAAYYAETVNVSGTEGRPIRYQGVYASAHLFDVLDMQPILGRRFRPEEDHPSTPPVIILSHRAWQDRYLGDPNIVGKTIRANSEVTTIVGIMPEKFDFPAQSDAWLPLRMDPLEFPRGSGPALEGTQIQAIARLKDGVTLDEAQTEMATIAGRLEAEYPETNEGIRVVVRTMTETFIGTAAITMLYTMLGAVFGVLLIACVNVANLLLARTVARSKEVAIRTALGSSRWRIVSQLLAETFVLAVAGGALGMLFGQVGIAWFNGVLANIQPPLWLEVGLDRIAVAFVVSLTLLHHAAGRHRAGATRVEDESHRGPQRRGPGVVGSAARADQPRARHRRDRHLVRPARRSRPDDQDGRQRHEPRLRLHLGQHLHRPARPPAGGLPDARRPATVL